MRTRAVLVLLLASVSAAGPPATGPAKPPATNAAKPPAKSDKPVRVTCKCTIVDAAGKPIAGAEIVAYERESDPDTDKATWRLVGKVITKADGVFSFSTARKDGNQGCCKISARKPGLAIGWANWKAQKNHAFEITLGKPDVLAGRVVDEKGKPIAGAKVEATIFISKDGRNVWAYTMPPFEWLTAKTDARGRFRFANVPRGAKASVEANAPGRVKASAPSAMWDEFIFPACNSDLLIVLPPEGVIRGVVVDKKTRKPVKGLRVIPQTTGFEMPSVSQVTGADGTFVIKSLPMGNYRLMVAQQSGRDPGWVASSVVVEVKKGEVKSGLTVELIKGGLVEVAVTDAETGKPVPGVHVHLTSMGPNGLHSGFTGKAGVALVRLVPGPYQLGGVTKPGMGLIGDPCKEVYVAEGKTKRLSVKLKRFPTVKGIVRDKQGKPVKGAIVQGLGVKSGSDRTDEQGRFQVQVGLREWHADSANVKDAFIVRHERRNLTAVVKIRRTAKAEITLLPGNEFVGRVVDSAGKPIPRAEIKIVLLLFLRPVYITVAYCPATDEEGRYAIKCVPIGREYNLVAVASGYAESTIRQFVEVPGPNRVEVKDIVLENLSVAGTVTDEDGHPIKDALVYVLIPRSGQSSENRKKTDAKGRFEIKGLARGRVAVFVEDPGERFYRGIVRVNAGDKDVKIKLIKRATAFPTTAPDTQPTTRDNE